MADLAISVYDKVSVIESFGERMTHGALDDDNSNFEGAGVDGTSVATNTDWTLYHTPAEIDDEAGSGVTTYNGSTYCCKIHTATGTYCNIYVDGADLDLAFADGKWYEISYDYKVANCTEAQVLILDASGTIFTGYLTSTTWESKKCLFQVSSVQTNMLIRVYTHRGSGQTANEVVWIDNFKIREVSNIIFTSYVSVVDSSSVAESIGRNLKCLIKPTTKPDIGPGAIDRTSNQVAGYTMIQKDNPANVSGKITKVWLWVNPSSAPLTGVEIATFYEGASNVFSTRDTETIAGDVAAGYQELAVDLDVQAGDYIGMYWTGGGMTYNTAGTDGEWYKHSDEIPCTGVTFTWWANAVLAIYGEGVGGGFDSVSVGESISTTGLSYINVNDPVGVTDVDAVSLLTLFNLVVNDNVGVAEDVGVDPLLLKAIVSDSSVITELVSNAAILAGIDVNDSISLAEYTKAARIYLISKYEEVGVAEALTVENPLAGISVVDAVSVLEKVYLEWWLAIVKDDTTWSDISKGDTPWSNISKDDTAWSDVR